MDKNQKILLIVLAFIMLVVISLVAFNVFMPKPEIKPNDIEVSKRVTEEEPVQTPEIKTKEYINVFFIGKNENNEEVYKAVKREYDKKTDGTKINFAIHSLISGPIPEEIRHGVYSEIPSGTKIIKITEQPDKITINLNSEYVKDGGADSLYKRLYQLIKTVKLNTNVPAYLYIDGQRADVIGGEGIMLSQPLSNSSLEN